ncbi:MAG: hypothetical protein LBI63_01630 [Candidatus Ancillula sp.]|nr:hypothetical protein [Candidatus Ancillula sp.]
MFVVVFSGVHVRSWGSSETSVKLSLDGEVFCTLDESNAECKLQDIKKINSNTWYNAPSEDDVPNRGLVQYTKTLDENGAEVVTIVLDDVNAPSLTADFTGDATIKVLKSAKIGAVLSKTGSNLKFYADGGDFTIDNSTTKSSASISGISNLTFVTGRFDIKSTNSGITAMNLSIKDGAKVSVDARSDAIALTSSSRDATLNVDGHGELKAVSETSAGINSEALKVVDGGSISSSGEDYGIIVMGKFEASGSSKVLATATGYNAVGILAHGIFVENGATIDGRATNIDDDATTYGIAAGWNSDIRAKGQKGDTTAIHAEGTVGITTLYPSISDFGNINIASASIEATGHADAIQTANFAAQQNSRVYATSTSATAVGAIGALLITDSSLTASGGEYGVNTTGEVNFSGSSAVTSSGATGGICSGESITIADSTEVTAKKTDEAQFPGETTTGASGIHAGMDLSINISDGGKITASSSSEHGLAVTSGGPTLGYIPTTSEKSTQNDNEKPKKNENLKLEIPYLNKDGEVEIRNEAQSNTGNIKFGHNARLGDLEVVDLSGKSGSNFTLGSNGNGLNTATIYSVAKTPLEKFFEKWRKEALIGGIAFIIIVVLILFLVVIKIVRGKRALIIIDMQENLPGDHLEISAKLEKYLKQHAEDFRHIFVTKNLLTDNDYDLVPELANNLNNYKIEEVYLDSTSVNRASSIFNGVVLFKKKGKTVPVGLIEGLRINRVKRVFVCGTLSQGAVIAGIQELANSKKFLSVVFLPELTAQVTSDQLERAKEVIKQEKGARIA